MVVLLLEDNCTKSLYPTDGKGSLEIHIPVEVWNQWRKKNRPRKVRPPSIMEVLEQYR